ncbi:uncharacterized protein LOC131947558 [Physella acuta]|uniref:uncharacterized protein LOC131947558 n=1 Tax=Physella acuta TaxID=109671 RepID=UPI0027DE148B|nr:uncharacterized protein LOC131947558 [Physella acuta]
MSRVKVLIAGARGSGKTCWHQCSIAHQFPTYIPVSFPPRVKDFYIQGRKVEVLLEVDDGHETCRRFSLSDSHVVVYCVDTDLRDGQLEQELTMFATFGPVGAGTDKD